MSASVVLALLLPAAFGSAADKSAPRIVKAVMGDADRDDRADRVVLTYSEPIGHRLDRDGRYPFEAGNYRILEIGKAAGSRRLVILLKEKSAGDIGARPTVKYSRTRNQPVRDAAGNQARGQTFSKTLALDMDGDGFSAVGDDCAPRDPSVHPNAFDDPDVPGFADTNCDGIDGDASEALFVSPSGDDENPGTRAAPLFTLEVALEQAALSDPKLQIYAASGDYQVGSGLVLVSGVGIYGGYDAGDWARSDAAVTSIVGAPRAAVAQSVIVTLQLLTLDARLPATPPAGTSTYGLQATGSTVLLEGVDVIAAAGAPGGDASSVTGRALAGADGSPGGQGVEDSTGLCTSASRPLGGPGGSSPVVSARGGTGGRPGNGGSSGSPGNGGGDGTGAGGGPGTPPGMGDWNTLSDYWGQGGSVGGPGAPGAAGAPAFTGEGYAPSSGAAGSQGGFGFGGGGGGGGGGGDDNCDSWGGGGGGGGAGGAGGLGGGGGTSGGGSFGVYAWGSTITLRASSISSAAGGAGGAGVSGQLGGLGGRGGSCDSTSGKGNCYGGLGEQDDGSNGGRGGDGGDGGDGGPGGGGAGGPSIGIVLAGGSSVVEDSVTEVTFGLGGAGGSSPVGGNEGPTGIAQERSTP